MTSRITFFLNILFMMNASHSMEIIKKNHPSKNYECYGITTQSMITKKIGAKHQLPNDVIKKIKFYNLALKIKSFENELNFITNCDNHHIPTTYLYDLKLKQKELLKKLLNKPYKIQRFWYENTCEIICFYSLNSKEDYELFLTLPLPIRFGLIKKPKSLIKIIPIKPYGSYIVGINPGQAIEIPKCSTVEIEPATTIFAKDIIGWHEKLMIPEIQSKKDKRLRHFYCPIII